MLARASSAIVISALLAWFYTAQDTRYLLPILPVGSVLLAGWLDHALGRLPRDWRRLAVPLADALLCTSVALLGVVYARARVERYGYPPATAEARHAYLADQLPAYDAIRWLNEHAGSYRAYQLYEEGVTYFFDGEVMGDWFGPGRYADITGAAISGQSLSAKLKSLAATHLVVSDRHEFQLPDDSVSRASFHLVYGARGVTVYELRDPEVPVQAEAREPASVEH